VWADLLFLTSGFAAETLVRAQAEYHVIRDRMAAGQYLDLVGTGNDPEVARRAAWLKGGSYTVEGPLLIGATLGDAAEPVREGLRRFGRPLGEAFQLRDDLEDGDAAPGVTPTLVNELVDAARRALDRELLGPEPTEALARLADLVAM
jgi:geranylgeranyl diphosphate synthase type I